MNNKGFGLVVFSLGVALASFLCAVVFMEMAKDLRNQVIQYKENGCVINE